MSAWRLITTWGASPEFNMGLDEALLLQGEQPTVRLYTWAPDTLSLGWFQRLDEVPGADRASRRVRRLTGGGAIHHQHELTFSLTAPVGLAPYDGTVPESYERVHAAIVKALAAVGLDARLRGDDPLTSDAEATGMCFHHSTPLDIAWGGAKGVGSAQRRRGGRVLHHGSIKLGTTSLEGPIATFEAAYQQVTPVEFGPHLLRGFEQELGLELRPGVPSPAERACAEQLGARYTTESWVAQR